VAELLPVGTVVRVTERRVEQRPFMQPDALGGEYVRTRTYVAKVVGYDLGRTKYNLGIRYATHPPLYVDEGGWWAFPGEVEPYEEER